MPWLIALDGGLSGRRFALDGTFLVGRGPYNHIVIDDVRISRQHAKISREAGGVAVHDLNSANGTFVNEEQVQRRELYPNDIVKFGPFRFRFEGDPDTEISIARPARRPHKVEELTRQGFEAPNRIVNAVDASMVLKSGLSELEDADRKLRTLYTFVHAISATLDQTELLDLIVKNLLDVFPSAQLAAIYMLERETKRMEPMRLLMADRRQVPEGFAQPMQPELQFEIVQKGRATLSAPMSLAFDDEPAAQSSGLVMHAPMMHQSADTKAGVLGVLHVRARDGASFSQGDLDLLTALSAHAALTLTSARMHQESLARERLAQDLLLAQEIQKSFLPTSLPVLEGISFAADYEPAYSIGGDFYDVFSQGPGRVGVIVGDVSGKGVSAALLMARVSSDLRAAMLREQGDPATALDIVNKSICARGRSDIFVTAICLSIDVSTMTLSFASAGHLPPYVRRHRGELLKIEDGASMPLGLFDDVPYTLATHQLGPLDTLVLCTDGVIEATSERNVQFGFEGMEASLRGGGHTPTEVCDRLLAAIRAHVGAAPQYDDLTLVVCTMGGSA